MHSECPLNKACLNNKCIDPCPGTCGYGARCKVVNHNPICSCPSGFIGDPFVRCIKEISKHYEHVFYDISSNLFIETEVVQQNPCVPSPCGAFSICKNVDNRAVCSCLPNYFGQPPNCRPECVVNSECPLTKACQNQLCIDPCPGSCGSKADCKTINHIPVCFCIPGFTGDPFSGCYESKNQSIKFYLTRNYLIITVAIIEEPPHPCNPSPCGANAICKELNGAGSCSCLPEYLGDPYLGCRPECVVNTDCPRNKACVNNKCTNPCPGTCGLNAECIVNKHTPSCSCIPGYTGNPLQACHLIPESKILCCIFA